MEQTDLTLEPTRVDSDDINQQAELLRLENVDRPNRQLIRRSMEANTPELHFGGWLPPTAEPFGAEEILPESVVAEILNWAETQDEKVYGLVLDFLSDATFDNLTTLLSDLGPLGIHLKDRKGAKPKSVAQLVKEYLGRVPSATLADLIDHIRPLHSARRPAATVRAALRRLQRKGLIRTLDGNIILLPTKENKF